MPKRPSPQVAPVSGATAAVGDDMACAPLEDLEGTLLTLEATGMPRWDALLMLVGGGVPASTLPDLNGVPERLRIRYADVDEGILAFARHAGHDPDGANAALAAFLGNRMVDKLALRRREWVRALPAGLEVRGNLNLYCCEAFRSLAARLRVRGDLRLLECPAWDGTIPPDAQVTGKVVTDTHPKGTPLAAWRLEHPQGERPDRLAAGPAPPWDQAVACVLAGADPGMLPIFKGVPPSLIRAHLDAKGLLSALNRIARTDPEGANATLGAWLAGRTLEGSLDLSKRTWVRSLPEGLTVRGNLFLKDQPAFAVLPKNLTVGRDLDLTGCPLTALPSGLEVGGHLNLRGTDVAALPEDLKLGGSLSLRETPMASLPEGLKVPSTLDLGRSKVTVLPKGLVVGALNLWRLAIEAIPEDLRVEGDLNLTETQVRRLPPGFRVGGDLVLRSTLIERLPKGLDVGGDLRLEGSILRALPAALRVGGSLYANGLPLTVWPEGAVVGGSINLEGTRIQFLPRGLVVGGHLLARGSDLEELPEGLAVKGTLDLRDTRIWSLPRGLSVGENLLLDGCQDWDGQILPDAKVKGRIHTPAHPTQVYWKTSGGTPPWVTLEQWRAQHPEGER
jgi:hypothetical protein